MRPEGQGSLTAAPASRTVVVAGAGIGGLTAAIALAEQRFHVIVLEKAPQLDQAGAGIQLSPNASSVLLRLGLEKHLADHVVTPDDISIIAARSGRPIVRIPLGASAQTRYGAPYWIIHRADLQAALLRRARENPDIDLQLDAPFEDVSLHASGVTVINREAQQQTSRRAVALVGADGVWSNVRHQHFGGVPASLSGHVAWRGTVDAFKLPRDVSQNRITLWLGAGAHLVAYPVRGGALINIVAIVAGHWDRPGWNEAGDASEIAAEFASRGWSAGARKIVEAADNWRKWALFTVEGAGLAKGPVALLGDAGHAMLPFAAQGAAMAIEDAAVLADCLVRQPDAATEAFRRYAAQRQTRVAQVRRTTWQAGAIYHLPAPVALARNLSMKLLGGRRLLSQRDWIYDWRLA
ncbi:FAD-dependent monooxygenase [Bradyrhizobium sp. LHD-71]|uniref:FAD-dependent monooxygenase n=1 Tax=Bradyrhizobium sp. LHD-71 TaxID=3072141 RepID=UPI00280FCEF2|nr:FAD-dependent monooxygenase [Bradyrhizobium sp. LHD-71]MDQ8726577.1 FAD-dependent monooxygenase [Bradyrhizobium sp. LHD-71]